MDSSQVMAAVPACPAVPTGRRRRRLLKTCALLLLIITCLALVVYGYYWWLGKQRLAEAIAQADRLDPGWRLEDMEAKREPVPDNDNAALVVIEAVWLTPTFWPAAPGTSPVSRWPENASVPLPPRPLFPGNIDHHPARVLLNRVEDVSPERRLDPKLADELRTAMSQVEGALSRARQLAEMPRGRYPSFRPAFGVPHLEVCIYMARVLALDSANLAQGGDIDAAVRSSVALINVGRSFGDEPTEVSQAERFLDIQKGLIFLNRALAQGQAQTDQLAALQAQLEAETAHPFLLLALRGERIASDEIWKAIEAGEIKQLWARPHRLLRPPATGFARFIEDFGPADPADIRWKLVPQLGHAWALKHSTEAIEIAKNLGDDTGARFEALDLRTEAECRLGNEEPVLESAFFFQISQRRQAILKCAIGSLAAERFRLQQGRWPDSFKELVATGLLTEVGVDSFDGQPLRLRRLTDGLVIYSVGKDGVDNGGKLDHRLRMSHGHDLGFRLWNVAQRAQPPTEANER